MRIRISGIKRSRKKEHPLTSTRVVFDEELIECHPTASHADHYCAAKDADQTQLLGFAELKAKQGC